MDESIIPPIAPTAEPPPSTPAYKDRSTGLLIFGVFTMLLGCLMGLFALLMVAGQMVAAQTNPPSANISMILPVVAMYGCLAVALIWLGIGSLQARRWARALLLVFSWSWLVIGVFAMIAMALMMPMMLATISSNAPPGQPPIPALAVVIPIFLILGFGFIVLPAIWTFFYRSRHVKATCEIRDPITRWTDACPLPVLAICLWLILGLVMMLLMPLTMHGVMPFFGNFLTGVPGTLYCLALGAVWAYAAWALYRLQTSGWWLILIALALMMISGWLTFSHHDIFEMYQLMGYPQAQIDQMQKMGIFTGHQMTYFSTLSALPFLIYLLFIKKYLRRTA